MIVLCYLFMLLLVGWAGFTWLATGHWAQGDFSVQGWQMRPEQYPVFATVILALLGIAIPLNMGAEIMHRHMTNRALLWGVVITMAGYLIATFGVLVVLPPKDLINPAFMTEIFTLAFGPVLGSVLGMLNAVVMIIYFLFAAPSIISFSPVSCWLRVLIDDFPLRLHGSQDKDFLLKSAVCTQN